MGNKRYCKNCETEVVTKQGQKYCEGCAAEIALQKAKERRKRFKENHPEYDKTYAEEWIKRNPDYNKQYYQRRKDEK